MNTIILLAVLAVGANWQAELPTIQKAGERNGCVKDDLCLLVAIRIQENGEKGTEFGVLHPKAKGKGLDVQAGWAAATIMKHHKRYDSDKVTDGFIYSLADRYCPKADDPEGNANWKKNVPKIYRKVKRELDR